MKLTTLTVLSLMIVFAVNLHINPQVEHNLDVSQMAGLASGDWTAVLPEQYRGIAQTLSGKPQQPQGAMGLLGNLAGNKGSSGSGTSLGSLASLASLAGGSSNNGGSGSSLGSLASLASLAGGSNGGSGSSLGSLAGFLGNKGSSSNMLSPNQLGYGNPSGSSVGKSSWFHDRQGEQ